MTRFFENKTTKIILLMLGIIMIFNGILGATLENLSLGVILTFVFGLCLILCGLCPNLKIFVVTKSIVLFIFVILLSYSIFVYVYGGNDTVTYNEDAVIVLGTVVIGDQPSTDLKNRLDSTISYHQNNPEAIVIITGGQGTDENDTEASVMYKYLINAGLPSESIIIEDKATSTVENFQYSSEIIKSMDISSPTIAYISNDFHLFRAGIIAKNAGFEKANHYHGKTPWHMVIPNGLRESIVTIKMWLID